MSYFVINSSALISDSAVNRLVASSNILSEFLTSKKLVSKTLFLFAIPVIRLPSSKSASTVELKAVLFLIHKNGIISLSVNVLSLIIPTAPIIDGRINVIIMNIIRENFIVFMCLESFVIVMYFKNLSNPTAAIIDNVMPNKTNPVEKSSNLVMSSIMPVMHKDISKKTSLFLFFIAKYVPKTPNNNGTIPILMIMSNTLIPLNDSDNIFAGMFCHITLSPMTENAFL